MDDAHTSSLMTIGLLVSILIWFAYVVVRVETCNTLAVSSATLLLLPSLTLLRPIFQWYSTIRPDSSSSMKDKDIRQKKTLLLDLDETLVHSTIKQPPRYHFRLQVTLTKIPTEFFVIKRPFVDKFLAQVRQEVHFFSYPLQRAPNVSFPFSCPRISSDRCANGIQCTYLPQE